MCACRVLQHRSYASRWDGTRVGQAGPGGSIRVNTMTDDRTRTERGYREERNGQRGFDRRSFLKGVGVGAAGLVTGVGATGAGAAAPGSPVMDLVDGDSAIERPTHTAVSSGRWADAATWDNGVPGDGARVLIQSGVTVTLASETARLHWVRVDGTYRVDTGTDSHLRVDTFTSTAGSTVEIGTATDPIDPSVTAEMTFVDRGPIDESWDPTRVSRGFLPMDRVSIHGAEKTEFTTLSVNPTAGDTTLELSAAPTNWQAGDALVVPGVSSRENQDEEVTLANVSGSTVAIEETLQYDHVPPAADLDTYVLNLDRNVRFRSENTATKRRGHGMLMETGNVVEYAGFYDMGRTDKSERFSNPDYGGSELTMPENANVKARYALHFHKTGPFRDVTPHQVTGCVVAPRTDGNGESGSPGWGFTNHQSYGHVTDSIAYRVFGAGFMTETGVEVGSFQRNFALRTEGSGRDPDWREFIENFNRERNIDDYGHNGVGFWLQGPLVTVKDNVAAGHRNFGFAYWNRALGDFVPDALPYDDPAEKEPPADDMTEAELGRHRGNVPNVPASEAHNKPTEKHNVAPDTPGPSVDEFAHATYEASDGTVYVDEGSIPIHNVGNTVFASGSGIDIMNQMRGADNDIVGGREEYYGRIEDFLAWNIHGRAGESKLTHTDLEGFGGVRGVDLGIGFRYSKFMRVRNVRLIGEDDGVGISHNMRMDGLVIEDSTIENFQEGIGALNPGLTTVRNTTIDTAESGVYVSGESVFGGESSVDLANVDGNNNTVWMDPHEHGFTKSDWDLNLTLNGADLYYEVQDPDHVLIPDQTTYDSYGGYSTFGVSFGDMVGKTVQQLADQYGIVPYGTLAPASATADPMIEGGVIDGDGSTDTAPTVSFTSAPSSATVDESVTLEASGSDADGGSVTYDWSSPAGSGTGSSFTTSFGSTGDKTVTVTVTDDEGQTATASAVVTVDSGSTGGDGGIVEAAINCGDSSGHTTSEDVTFRADTNYSGGAADVGDISIANTDEDGLYDSNRWGNDTVYDVPVGDAGATYDVTLHFAETYWRSAGARVFDVLVEGATVLSSFDPYAAAGGRNTAVSRTITGVSPTDGSVTISFDGIADNALVSGIEITASGSNTTAPTASITAAPDSATVGESVTFEASGSDEDGGSVSYEWSSPAGSGTGSAYTTSFGSSGEKTVTVTVTDGEGQTATASTTVTVESGSGTVEAAINCGDSSGHTTSEGVTFEADTHFNGGAVDSADRSIAGTDEDGLYDSNRWGNETTYDVPVGDAGATYDVTLHFAETYWSSSGSRVFDVLVEGTTELSGFDPYAAAGGQKTAVSRTISDVSPTDGSVAISFEGIADNALVSGIEIVRR